MAMSLRRSKSLYGQERPPDPAEEGYLDPIKLKQKNMVTSAVDDDDEDRCYDTESFNGVYNSNMSENPEGVISDSQLGGPFSALTPSMWPLRSEQSSDKSSKGKLAKSNRKLEIDDDTSEYDEFGFKIEVEDGPEQCSSKVLSVPFVDNQHHKLKWMAHLEFQVDKTGSGHRSKIDGRSLLAWETLLEGIDRTDELRKMVREGIPHSLRPYVWMRLTGAIQKKASSELSYKHIVKASSNDHLVTSRQIEKDLLRTLPNNLCFISEQATGVPRLRRILRGVAWLYPDIGYCQGMGMIVATFLLIMEEEDAFWMMVAVVEDLLPSNYYSPSLVGVQADQMVLRGLIAMYLPPVENIMLEHDIELSLITLNWFLTLYSSVLHIKILLRLWDIFLFDGSRVMFQIAIGMISMHEEELLEAENSADIFNLLSTLPSRMDDIDALLSAMENVTGTITDEIIDDNRRRFVSVIVSERGSWRPGLDRQLGGTNPKLLKRTIKRSKSVVDLLLFGENTPASKKVENYRTKNIRQTELIISLRDAILRIAQYFQAADPTCISNDDIQTDYSTESHTKDLENYASISRGKLKRARAILDFERKDDDELGFRKNDIITIVSQRDEHCWVGELNGHTGWFPAKLVEVLDERSKQYSFAGDDSVSVAIADLVRGVLCPAIKSILEHGLQKSSILMGPVHPWQFIEEAVAKEVEKDFNSVYSRLVLCKTFRLNEDSKVLSPEELLYRCVEAVNFTHNPKNAQMDIKLRSLICLGLNEQAIHLWLESLASNEEVVKKYYQPSSFLGSPGWVQIKCELRLLSKFSFNLNPEWELLNMSGTTEDHKSLQEGVRDMLVSHHLFSWDL